MTRSGLSMREWLVPRKMLQRKSAVPRRNASESTVVIMTKAIVIE
jgi:hypothetical protein